MGTLQDLPSDESGCDVLVVDDDAATVELLVTYLATKHVHARGLMSSTDYLNDIKKVSPRLVLLDVHLPGTNGYELCDLIKKNEATRAIKVYFFTAMPMAEVISRVDDKGADGYLLKPFNLTDLDRLVGVGKQA